MQDTEQRILETGYQKFLRMFYSRQGRSNQRRDPTRPPKSFRTVLLQAKLEQEEQSCNPSNQLQAKSDQARNLSYQEFQDFFTLDKVRAARENIPTHPTRIFRIVSLESRLKQREKISNPLYQEFQDCFTPGKVGATREKIKPVLPGISGLFCSRQGQSN